MKKTQVWGVELDGVTITDRKVVDTLIKIVDATRVDVDEQKIKEQQAEEKAKEGLGL